MSELGNWKFIISDSITYEETTSYPSHLDEIVAKLSLPDNALSRAKLMIEELHSDVPLIKFQWNGGVLTLPPEHIMNFHPFIRASGTASSGSADVSFFYLLNGVEHEVKKNH